LIKNNTANPSPEYWFYIETYVHISIKKNSLLLYNSFTGKALEYDGKSNGQILNLVKRMQSHDNLWIIRLTEEDLQDPEISKFVNDIRSQYMGDLLDTAHSQGKPIKTVPMFSIHKNVQLLKKQGNRSVGEGMMEYLTELFLYSNGDCPQDCHICKTAFKQFPCCTKVNSTKHGSKLSVLQDLFNQLAAASLTNINILGGNILAHEPLADLVTTLNRLPCQKTYYCHYLNTVNHLHLLKMFNSKSSMLKIPVTFPLDEEKLTAILEEVKNTAVSATFMFILQDEAEYEWAEKMIISRQIPHYEFKPFFNGKNMAFFRQNVFFSKEEILESKPSLRDIYQNSVVNSLNFGRLTIFNNGDIHANANAARLGTLGKSSLYDVLYKEMYHGKSWRRIRSNITPCKSCTFQSVCPPLSNYAFAIGRSDLCFKGNNKQS